MNTTMTTATRGQAELLFGPVAQHQRPGSEHRILVGTASWTDPTLIKSGRFYPKGCTSAEARLRYYASRFPLVEVNSSYYAVPDAGTAQLWAERTPNDFVFNIKAFRLFTGHQAPIVSLPPQVREALGSWPKANIDLTDMPAELIELTWQLYKEALLPLRAAGKLGAIHFQFTPRVQAGKRAEDLLEDVRSRLPGDLLTVEFRHRSWFDDAHRERTFDFERQHGLVNVVVDSPQGFVNSVGTHWEVTNPELALVRLHGRNAETWNVRGPAASDRFNYRYSTEELKELAVSVRQLAKRVGMTHVVFNNNFEDQGQANAAELLQLLR